ncbi:MAG: hypothetical protein HY286_06555 [Planctomycetes bacterium]|nr:hypothetical protein [Planctomycetota bacterium]
MKARILASLLLLSSGPCLELAIQTDVHVLPSGDSTRHVIVETSDPSDCDLRSELPGGEHVSQVLFVIADPAFQPANIETFDSQLSPKIKKDSKRRAWETTKSISAGTKTSDLTIVRRGETAGATNEATVRVDSFVLFRKITYVEIVRDTATRESMAAATAQVASTVSEVVKRAGRALLSDQYDLTDFENYLQSGFRRSFARMLVNMLDEDPDRPSGLMAVLDAMIQEGIPAPVEKIEDILSGKETDELVKNEVLENLKRAFTTKIASLLKRKGATKENPGLPIKPEELSGIYNPGLLDSTLQRAMVDVTGKESSFEDLFKSAGGQLFGNFGGVMMDPELGSARTRWRTVVSMPGQMLRSNGVPLRDGRVLWLHLSGDMALRSTRHEAESIELDRTAIASVGGDASNLKPEDYLELLSALGNGRDRKPNPKLIATLRAAVDGDASARHKVEKGDDFETVAKILKISKKDD